MKKKTNILLFSGLAVILVLMVLGFRSLFVASENTRHQNDDDETYVAEKVEKRDLEIFDAIENEGVCVIEYVQSDRSAVEISASEYVIDRIVTVVEEGKLKVSMKPIRNNDAKNKLTVYSPTCRSIKNEGVGSITCDSLSTDMLKVENEGVGNIIVNNLAAKKLKVENEGVGSITVAGTAESARLENEGLGKIDASDLKCSDVDVFNEGMGIILTE